MLPIYGAFANQYLIIMGRNTSISLGNHFESLVNVTIESGRFSNTSEVIRAGLRLLEEEEQKLKALRKALEVGEMSGYVENYDPKTHLSELLAKFKNT
ncbi:MAG: type II toxin-antitoxin system ParD family antitoxin [Saprospiraceae bacterium]